MDEFLETITYPGFLKVALRYWRVGIYEMYRSFSKRAFVEALQKLIPEITEDDLVTGGSGVRAQLCQRDGNLVDDFMIEYAENAVHVINAPSPAATSALQIGKLITEKILYKLA
jgi:L-2-hydroxyglutarate oxidase